jgi:hypothetical protein
MYRVLTAANERKHALLESPTGTGKTMALLCSSLAWQEHHFSNLYHPPPSSSTSSSSSSSFSFTSTDNKKKKTKKQKVGDEVEEEEEEEQKMSRNKVFYCSRTHSQVKQVVTELRRTTYRPKMAVLASREHLCVHPVVSQRSNKNHECKRLLETTAGGGCSYKKRMEVLRQHRAIQVGGPKEIWDVEDLAELGREVKACSYFTSRALAKDADLILCPYNYLLDPVIRESLDIDLTDALVIIDEAHNIEEACRSAASFHVDIALLEEARDQLLFLITEEHRWSVSSGSSSFSASSTSEEKGPISLGVDEERKGKDSSRVEVDVGVGGPNSVEVKKEKKKTKGELVQLLECSGMIGVLGLLLDWLKEAVMSLEAVDFEQHRNIWKGDGLWVTLAQVGITAQSLSLLLTAVKTLSAIFYSELAQDQNETDEEDEEGRRRGRRSSGGGIDGVKNGRRKANKNETEQPRTSSSVTAGSIVILQGLFRTLEAMLAEDYRHFSAFRLVLDKQFKRPEDSPGAGAGAGASSSSSSSSTITNRYGDVIVHTGYWVYSLNLWCMSPAVAFSAVAQAARAIVLTSGTLSPMEHIESELGVLFPLRFEAQHVINVPQQLWAGSLSRVHPTRSDPLNASFKNTDAVSHRHTHAHPLPLSSHFSFSFVSSHHCYCYNSWCFKMG